ncbi:MAG: hypothetical protein ILO34_00350, partial [Kiritimatiellae bacterium]|nr:hypothetical protein [Kiritimatiellia bacterium]
MNDAIEIFTNAFSPPPDAPGGAIAVSSLTGAADAFLALTRGGFVLAAVPGLPDADRLLADLEVLGANGPHRIL